MALSWLPQQVSPMSALLKGIPDDLIKNMMERKKQAQAEKHWQEEMELRKKQFSRSGANSDLQRRMLELQVSNLEHQQDPTYAYNKIMAIQNKIAQDAMGQGGQGGQGGQPNGQQQYPELENMFKGQGMFNLAPDQQENGNMTGMPAQFPGQDQQAPNQMPEQPQPTQQPSQPSMGGLNLDLMRKNPAFHAMVKSILKYDPLAQIPQTPEEKNAAALNLFNQKEAIKANNKATSGEILTAPIKTKYQNVIGGAASAKPILRKLIQEVKKGQIPGQMIGARFKRNAQASYKGEISTLLDGIRNAYTIPNTDSGTEKAEDKVLRKNGESDDNYAKRLQTILDQIEAREKDATTKLKAGNITAGKTVHLVGPDGADYDVPESEVNSILAEHPEVRRG